MVLWNSLSQQPCNPFHEDLLPGPASPSRPGSARISSTPRSLWSLRPFPATLCVFASTSPPSAGKFSLPVWLSPRPVTHQHVTRAQPTSPGTPRPFYCTRPSATLSALHLPIGSGHRPAARSWTLGPPAHARRTLLFLRLGPAPLPDSEAATWAWARNLPHTALPLSSAHHPIPTG